MKLSARQTNRAASQIDARVVPDDHPIVERLTKVYGDHTFFLDADGLEIVEAAEPTTSGEPMAQVVNIADWADAERSSLVLHEPEPTDVTVELELEEPDWKD